MWGLGSSLRINWPCVQALMSLRQSCCAWVASFKLFVCSVLTVPVVSDGFMRLR